MNAISKRLLSWLCVFAMVLSFVPVMDMAGLAVESQAASEEVVPETASETVTPGQANLPEGISTTNPVDNSDAAIDAHVTAGTCPMCGATGITWVKKTVNVNGATDDQEQHYYYEVTEGQEATTYTIATNTFSMTNANTRLCIAVKSGVTLKNTKYRTVMMGGSGSTLNIMGTGTILSDQVSATQGDYGVMQLGGGTAAAPNVVNLYGGSYQHVTDQTDTTNDDQAVIRIMSAYVTVNMWDGAIIGPETVDTTQWSHNVRFKAAGTFNMYGGIIRNGVTKENGISGNVTVSGGGTFNMYGGTIEGGQFLAGTDADGNAISSPANTGGNVVVGGKSEKATSSSAGKFYMYGGTVTGGKANNGGNGGGNIVMYNAGSTMELMGGTIKDGWAKAEGGNLQIMAGTTGRIGGTVLITNGEAKYGGNIQIDTGMKLTMEGGYIQGGTLAAVDGTTANATQGGAVYVNAGTFEMTGGEIDGCKTSGNGGNIYTAGGSTVNIGANATIKNGLTTTTANGGGGGNIYMAASGTNGGSIVTTEGTITGGTVNGGSSDSMSSGGNICVVASGAVQSVLTVNGGVIADGTVTYTTKGSAFGGNIRSYNAKVVINDGLIYNGNGGDKSSGSIGVMGGTSTSANTNSTLEINGGIIVGGISGCTVATGTETTNTAGDTTYTHTCSIKLTGAPKILSTYKVSDTVTSTAVGGRGLNAHANGPLDVSGLTEGAEIQITGSLGCVFSTAMDETVAAAVKGYFTTTNSAYAVDVNADNKLYIIEKPVERPEKPVASAMGDANWTDAAWELNADAKLLQQEMTLEKLTAHVEAGTCPICGTVEGGWVEATKPGSLSDADTKYHYYVDADTEISYAYNWACLYGSNQTLCFALLNGETEKQIDGLIAARGGSTNAVVNIMGEGVIKCGDTMSDKLGLLRTQGTNPTMNIYGGTFYRTYVENADGQTAPKGALLVADTGTVNIFEGVTIGRAEQADTAHFNVLVKKATLNMYGGTIQNGRSNFGSSTLADNYSGNVTLHEATSVFNMYGGTIKNGAFTTAVTTGYGGNIAQRYSGATLNITGGTIENGTATTLGGNIYGYGLNMTVSGGQILGGTAPSGASVVLTGGSVAEITGYAKIANGQCTSETSSDGGGNVKLTGGSTQLTISGGLIADGSTYYGPNGDGKKADGTNITSPCGGNIHINAATVIMTDGEISGGKANSNTASGSIYITGNGKFNMSGGKLHGGRATYAGGGNIGVWKGTVELSGTAEVYDGYANGSGGNISIASGSTTTNALTIKSGAKVYNGKAGGTEAPVPYTQEQLDAAIKAGTATSLTVGKASNGGNINMNGGSGDYATTLTIEEGAQVYGGFTSTKIVSSYSGETFKQTATSGMGGNIYVSGANDVVTIAGTVSGGTAYWGGNVAVNGGATVNITGTLDAGHAYLDGDHGGGNLSIENGTVTTSGIIKNGTSDANGGNIHIKNDTSTLTISGGEIFGGVAANQGGAIRGYNGHIYMTGGKIYGNTATKEVTDNVWCVRTHLTMSGDAQVVATEGVTRSAVSMIAYNGESAVLTLADNATIIGANGAAVVQRAADTTIPSLQIKDGWNGTAYVNLDGTSYKAGDEIAVDRAIAVDANGAQGGTYTGKLYYGTSAIGVLPEADGSLILAAAAYADADGNVTWVGSNESALDNYYNNNGTYVILNGSAEISGDVFVELNGADLTLTGTGTVYGMDNSNDDYSGFKKLTVDGVTVAARTINPDNGNYYISLQNSDGTWSFHRVEMILTNVTLRTTEAGLYYKATFKCDDTLAGAVLGYGAILSAYNMPGDDFMTETDDINAWTLIDGTEFTPDDSHELKTTSAGLFGILKESKTEDENVAAAQTKVYANLYLAIDRTGEGDVNAAEYFLADIVNQDAEAGTSFSLLEVMEAINKTENWSRYSDTQKANVKAALLTWAGWITDAAAAEWQSKFNNILA